MASPRYWLLKSEPDSYSIDDLERDGRTCWDGVRNYQARNFMRDDMKVGDLVLFYHSSAEPTGVAGMARVVRTAYPDHTALDRKSSHFDPKATREDPIWLMIDIEFVRKFTSVVPLEIIRRTPALAGMAVLKPGQRLSIQPVEAAHFKLIERLAHSST